MEVEHRRHGFPFEDLTTRYARLEEQLEMLRRLWDPQAQPFDFNGTFVAIADADFWPAPDPRPRIVIGGSGLQKTPRLAALYGDELNAVFLSPEQCREQRAALDAACSEVDRDPATVRYSLMTRCLVGRTLDEFRDRAARSQQRAGRSGSLIDYIDSLQPHWLVGTSERVRGLLAEFADAGVEQVMLQHLQVDDLEMLDLVAEDLFSD
jgi:alkanesulfonate monooxygenase SsuD/methylene tetrahydromethanopterin reductase-like flavin-dependent oxidoreductase (luciferase family)